MSQTQGKEIFVLLPSGPLSNRDRIRALELADRTKDPDIKAIAMAFARAVDDRRVEASIHAPG